MLENILSNSDNLKVLKYLGIKVKDRHDLISFKDKKFNSHEGLDHFLKTDVPEESKYVLDSNGIIVMPETGEIIAFQFSRFDSAFKLINPNKYRHNYLHIKRGLLQNFKFRDAMRVSLAYFSNIWGDSNTVIDVRELGKEWGLAIYFLDDTEQLIQEYYKHRIENKKKS